MSEMIVPADAPVFDAPQEPEAPSWSGPSEEDWASTQNALAYLAENIQQSQAPAEPGPQGPQFDLFADDASDQLQNFIQQTFQQQMQPLMDWQQSQQLGEAEERAFDILSDISSREGEFVEQDKAFEFARALANSFMPEETQRRGYGPQAAEAALARAASVTREYEKAIGQAYVERHMNQLKGLGGARPEPGAGMVGAQQLTTEPGGDEMSIVRRYGGMPLSG